MYQDLILTNFCLIWFSIEFFIVIKKLSLECGNAFSALKHTIPGDQNLVNLVEVENLMLGDGSGKLKR